MPWRLLTSLLMTHRRRTVDGSRTTDGGPLYA